MKVMICQGMNGRKTSEIEEERNEVIEKLNKMDIEVVDTIFNEKVTGYLNPSLYYISKSIAAMGSVNAIIFIGDWKNYRRCRIEHQIAKEYGIKILYEDFLDNRNVNDYLYCYCSPSNK